MPELCGTSQIEGSVSNLIQKLTGLIFCQNQGGYLVKLSFGKNLSSEKNRFSEVIHVTPTWICNLWEKWTHHNGLINTVLQTRCLDKIRHFKNPCYSCSWRKNKEIAFCATLMLNSSNYEFNTRDIFVITSKKNHHTSAHYMLKA